MVNQIFLYIISFFITIGGVGSLILGWRIFNAPNDVHQRGYLPTFIPKLYIGPMILIVTGLYIPLHILAPSEIYLMIYCVLLTVYALLVSAVPLAKIESFDFFIQHIYVRFNNPCYNTLYNPRSVAILAIISALCWLVITIIITSK